MHNIAEMFRQNVRTMWLLWDMMNIMPGGDEAGSVASIDFVTDGIDGTLKEVPKEN